MTATALRKPRDSGAFRDSVSARADLLPPLGLYVHWPFCLKKCPYCDFNSHVRKHVPEARWLAALLAEMDHMATLTGPRHLVSVFFGGGTPSLMAPDTVAAILTRAGQLFALDEATEITLEANPSSVEAERFAGYARAGVNRLSVGVQSFDNAALRFLGRLHDADEARRAIKIARDNFERCSFDLIYTRPGQTWENWLPELEEALGYDPAHISLYQLTIEPGTAFAEQYRRGVFSLPDEATAAALFTRTRTHLAAHGLPAYEISNHAQSGEASRHNLIYWQGGDYAGVGPGAHGRLTLGGRATATETAKKPEDWLARVEAQGHGIIEQTPLDPATRAEEGVMMGLRLDRGIDRAAFNATFGTPLADLLDEAEVAALAADGYLDWTDGTLSATEAGFPLLDHLLARILR